MKVGDKLTCKKRLDLYYPGVVGDIEFDIRPNQIYEIADLYNHKVSIKVDHGFCVWFTTLDFVFDDSKRLDEYFYTTKEIRKTKLTKINDKNK